MRLGVINWDATYLPNTYFGYYCSRSLSPSKYRNRVPYFATIEGENKISFPPKTQESYDAELQLAIDAGIDYFAYVWYGEENQTALGYRPTDFKDCSGSVWELNTSRHLYTTSKLNAKINMCAIMCSHPMTDYDLRLLTYEMAQPYYEKINGRPLLYFFAGAGRADEILRVKRFCRAKGFDPYICVMGIPSAGFPFDEVDALSQYAVCKGDIRTFAELMDEQILKNEQRNACPVRETIPGFTMGWNPDPRIDSPCPWTNYAVKEYTGAPTPAEAMEQAQRLAQWIKDNPKAQSGHILTYAWNEFEEGGWICPTVTDNSNWQGFRAVAKYWHETFGE